MKVVIHFRPTLSQLVPMLTGRGPEPGEHATGIAPANLFSQHIAHNVITPCRLEMRRKCVRMTRRFASWSHDGTA
jgi:hypothetical protein